MKPLRVLLLTAYYEPEITALSVYVSNAVHDLAKQRCEVHVITPMPTRDVDKQTQLEYREIPLETLEDGRLTIRRLRIPFAEPRNLIARALRYVLVMTALLLKGLFMPADVVLLYSAPPLIGLMGAVLRLIRRVPVVYYLQDIFPDSLINSGVSSSRLPVVFGRWMERVTYRAATRIIVICQDFRENLLAKGVTAQKLDLIYNWVDESMIQPVPRQQNRVMERFGLNPDAFYVTYSGNVGTTQNLELLVDVAERLRDYKDMRFLIIGNGSHEADLRYYAGKKKLDNLAFMPFQDAKDLAHVLSIADVGIILSKPNIGQNSFPSKTWYIMAAARSLIASFDLESELHDIVDAAQCGLYVPPDDRDAFEQAILTLYRDRDLCRRLGENGRRYIEQNLTRGVGTAAVLDVLRRAAGCQSS